MGGGVGAHVNGLSWVPWDKHKQQSPCNIDADRMIWSPQNSSKTMVLVLGVEKSGFR